MQPLVSIIIPTFNRAHLIGETLDSVLAQTYQNWECLVVDDGSNDSTPRILEKYSQLDERFRYLERPDYLPKGGNAARNYGFEHSKGDYVQWFDDDDIMHVGDCGSRKMDKTLWGECFCWKIQYKHSPHSVLSIFVL